jgi:hypothetical protein
MCAVCGLIAGVSSGGRTVRCRGLLLVAGPVGQFNAIDPGGQGFGGRPIEAVEVDLGHPPGRTRSPYVSPTQTKTTVVSAVITPSLWAATAMRVWIRQSIESNAGGFVAPRRRRPAASVATSRARTALVHLCTASLPTGFAASCTDARYQPATQTRVRIHRELPGTARSRPEPADRRGSRVFAYLLATVALGATTLPP